MKEKIGRDLIVEALKGRAAREKRKIGRKLFEGTSSGRGAS